jgi:hypothetical protein
MRRFLAGYGGRSIDHVISAPGGDQVAIQTLIIRCSSTSQSVDLVWSWTDGTWRSHPGFTVSAADQPGDYLGCS